MCIQMLIDGGAELYSSCTHIYIYIYTATGLFGLGVSPNCRGKGAGPPGSHPWGFGALPGAPGAPKRQQGCSEEPLTPTKRPQETAHEMRCADLTISVAPNVLFRVSMRFPRDTQGVETVKKTMFF